MNVVVFAAHPDDAEINAGGTMARMVDEGHDVTVITAVCPPITGDVFHDEVRRLREAELSAGILGVRYRHAGFSSEQFTDSHHVVSTVNEMVDGFGPDLIITHRMVDSHQDHRTCGRVVASLARRNRIDVWEMNHSIPGGLHPTSGSNLYVGFGEDRMFDKRRALECFPEQAEFLETIYRRDEYYGGMIGVPFAEAFTVVHSVW